MKKSLIYIFSLMLCGVCGKSWAQTLTLEECVNKALEHNRSLSSAKLTLEKTRFDSKAYKANFFPQFNLMAVDFYSTANGSIV